MVITVKVTGKDPFPVLVEMLGKINQAETVEDFEALSKLLVRQTSLH
ncbi:MAG: hypothetical protein SGJ18_15200 [Pseudomonadota bacterium]|nr:hypothetical protein [Pseudomonadota bacterium]